MTSCRVCGSPVENIFTAQVRRRHEAVYQRCGDCGFVQIENPHWLDEAYRDPMASSDTGAVARCLDLANVVSILIFFLFDRRARHLDFAGGYGLFTRRMRDIGFDYLHTDRYARNLLAQGFDDHPALGPMNVVTSFESLEHFVDPPAELEAILARTRTFIFTTEVLPEPVPSPGAWYYYGVHHGQHVAFYTPESLHRLAGRFGLRYYCAPPVHIFTDKPLRPVLLGLLIRLRRFGLPLLVRRCMTSRTVSDSIELARREDAIEMPPEPGQ